MEITWYGHSVVTLYDGTTRIMIDPFLSGNPLVQIQDFSTLPKIDYILITHDHDDHTGDVIPLAQSHKAKVAGVFDTMCALQERGLPSEYVHNGMGFNIGGTITLGSFKVLMVPALHTSKTGVPVGYFISNGSHSVYHTGDTAPYSDMALWSQMFPVDTLCVPIGGYFTADPAQAVQIAEYVQPKKILPMHYKTFPVLEQSTDTFTQLLQKKLSAQVITPQITTPTKLA